MPQIDADSSNKFDFKRLIYRFLALQLTFFLILTTFAINPYLSGETPWLRGIFTDFVLLHLFALLFIGIQKNYKTALILFFFSTFSLFAAMQIKYNLIFSWPVVGDLFQIDDLFRVLPIYAILLITAPIIFASFQFLKNVKPPSSPAIHFVAVLISFSILSVIAVPNKIVNSLNRIHSHQELHGNSYLQKGVLFAIVYAIADASQKRIEFAQYREQMSASIEPPFNPAPIAGQPNIHVIVMESLMDPLDLQLKVSQDPFSKKFRSWLGGKLYAPVYGGGTAQSEFEILCSTPSMAVIEQIVFSGFRGGSIPCWPGLLSKQGYKTISWTGTTAGVFNGGTAYKSIGFNDSYFERAYDASDMDGGNVSNRSMFSEIRTVLTPLLASKTQLVTYAMTMSGHQPYDLHESRPNIITTSGPDIMTLLVNNTYYNAKEAEAHIEWLLENDPDSTIILTGDHQGSKFEYEKNWVQTMENTNSGKLARYQVPYLFIKNRIPQSLGQVSLYELPQYIFNAIPNDKTKTIRNIGEKWFEISENGSKHCVDKSICSEIEKFKQKSIIQILNLRRLSAE
jgi:phosphoglycerol transferase MdoB-like AlkP superfamily enzyme